MREIEVKLKAMNLKEIEHKLASMGCKLSDPINQHDLIYSKKGSTVEWEESKVGHIVMRIRREEKGGTFNLKQQLSGELDNTEIETKVDDPDAMHAILDKLGYAPMVEVKKVRRKGKLGEYEICLDEVEQLGSFVELEKLTSDDADPLKTEDELLNVLESIGLSRSDRVLKCYDTQIYFLKKQQS
jgi:adenylate cyclase class 2